MREAGKAEVRGVYIQKALHAPIKALVSEMQGEMSAEMIGIVLDAARYRHLRSNKSKLKHGSVYVVRYDHPKGKVFPEIVAAGFGEDLDLAVDDSMLGE